MVRLKKAALRPVRERLPSSSAELLSEEELTECIEVLCDSKANEFRLYGYEEVTSEQVWACISEDYRRGMPRLNRLVNDILSLKPGRFMNWLMLSVYKQPDEHRSS
ncbi:post-transcriptional regulator [Mechercharimyces sp. CAU 1602]|uniref:post-transcriptional regulator n=1 Tax=Mechercharimyces sp. CAU 1602 TaxID=2973933 RepID=UPI002163A238|nr:post-transcriptional regulator [Mechercharimyces sp. CAU 1602]MCS1350683.1 post-transcriptional regulator [Mechercharimyces sp. CAU 1602]